MRKIDRFRWVVGATLLAIGILPAAAATAGNDHYQVYVNESYGGVGIGTYTATTGILHPVTQAYGPQNVLFGGGTPSSSWTVVHSYTSGASYSQRRGQALAGGTAPPLILEDFAVPGEEAVPIGAAGIQTHYIVMNGGGGLGPDDDLDIYQTLRAVGTGFNDSAVEISTQVFNISGHTIELGIRYLLDFQIGGGDDGPAFQLRGPDGPVQIIEQSLPVPAALTFEMLDNNDPSDLTCAMGPTNTPFPLLSVSGSVRGPTRLQPTAPTLLDFVSWQHISGLPGKTYFFPAPDAFFYNVGPYDASTCTISYDDSAVAYYWGEVPGSSFFLLPGQSVKVSAYLFAYLPGQPPAFPPNVEDCENGIDDDGDGLVDGQDPDCVPLAVTLASFEARPARRDITLSWTTASEIDSAGFLLLRGTSPNGPFAPITPFLIASRGGDVSGAVYQYVDRGVRRRKLYYYKLVDVDVGGMETEHGPVAAALGAPKTERRRR